MDLKQSGWGTSKKGSAGEWGCGLPGAAVSSKGEEDLTGRF